MDSKSKFLCKITPRILEKYEQNGVYFTKPSLVAFYDYDYGNLIDGKSIKYFRNPRSDVYPMDLNEGFDTYIDRKRPYIKIEPSLKYMMSCEAQKEGTQNIDKIKVITTCGALSQIIEEYYWRGYRLLNILVSRYKGVIYIIKYEHDEDQYQLNPVHTHHSQLLKHIFTDSPNDSPHIDLPTDENITQFGVYRSSFGKYDIIYSAQIQGIMSGEKLKDTDLNALNDSRFVLVKQMWANLYNKDKKYFGFWMQSYLTKVSDIYIGYKNEEGFIEEPLEHKIPRDIPKQCYWDPSKCMGILYEFLQNVEKVMSSVNSLNTVFCFHYNREDKSYYYEIYEGKHDKMFLTEEYMNYCQTL